MKIRIEDNINLERDLSSKAVINNNVSGYKARLKQKKLAEENQLEIDSLKRDITEIKSMLKQIIGGI
jgi:hypothetical protein